MRVDPPQVVIGCVAILCAVAMWRNREDFATANNNMREDMAGKDLHHRMSPRMAGFLAAWLAAIGVAFVAMGLLEQGA